MNNKAFTLENSLQLYRDIQSCADSLHQSVPASASQPEIEAWLKQQADTVQQIHDCVMEAQRRMEYLDLAKDDADYFKTKMQRICVNTPDPEIAQAIKDLYSDTSLEDTSLKLLGAYGRFQNAHCFWTHRSGTNFQATYCAPQNYQNQPLDELRSDKLTRLTKVCIEQMEIMRELFARAEAIKAA